MPNISMWEVIKARGGLSNGTGTGAEGVPNEVWKRVPWDILELLWAYFNNRLRGAAEEDPFWKLLLYFGLSNYAHTITFADFRWICKSASAQKLYLRTILPRLEAMRQRIAAKAKAKDERLHLEKPAKTTDS